jgi:hypothetical protein
VTKPLKIAPWVVPEDLQAIYDYHRLLSVAKAERILAEYDRIIALLEQNPLLFHTRENGWRVYPFEAGTYLLYYMELETFWLSRAFFFMPGALRLGFASNFPAGPELLRRNDRRGGGKVRLAPPSPSGLSSSSPRNRKPADDGQGTQKKRKSKTESGAHLVFHFLKTHEAVKQRAISPPSYRSQKAHNRQNCQRTQKQHE